MLCGKRIVFYDKRITSYGPFASLHFLFGEMILFLFVLEKQTVGSDKGLNNKAAFSIAVRVSNDVMGSGAVFFENNFRAKFEIRF